MTETLIPQKISNTELDELVSNEVTCVGNSDNPDEDCPNPVVWVRVGGHRCPHSRVARHYKCEDHYQAWLYHANLYHLLNNCVRCGSCSQIFQTLEEFSRYIRV